MRECIHALLAAAAAAGIATQTKISAWSEARRRKAAGSLDGAMLSKKLLVAVSEVKRDRLDSGVVQNRAGDCIEGD